ncbi:MAG: hypothetical protein OEM39_03045 [Acidimicrobiia bacterium]|nr:hypothetical protein [Acidimicrobiia bacterium]MDH3462491.1 hypothetical protein [Acidimicrobiia bacterium]
MEPTLDQVRHELASIHDELLELPANDFARRSALKERQNELRQKSRELAEGLPLHDAEALKKAFKRLEEVRDRLLDERLNVSGEGMGDAGIDNVFIGAVNRAIESGLGIDEVEARLAEILRQLKSSS